MAMQHHHLALLAGRLPCPKQLALAQCGGQQVGPLVADEGHSVALLALADSDDQLIVGLRTGGNVHELAVGPLQGGGREDSAAVAPPTAVMSPPTDLVGHLLILRIPCCDALRANSKQALESDNMGGEGGEGDRQEGEGGEGGAGEVRSRRVTKHPPRPAFFLYSLRVHEPSRPQHTHAHTHTHTHAHTHTRTHTHTHTRTHAHTRTRVVDAFARVIAVAAQLLLKVDASDHRTRSLAGWGGPHGWTGGDVLAAEHVLLGGEEAHFVHVSLPPAL